MSSKLIIWSPTSYLNDIQIGIQSLHSYSDMINRHSDNPLYKQWSTEDKTIVRLKRHGHSNMTKLLEVITILNQITKWNLPIGRFHEPELNNTLTSICIIIPNELRNIDADKIKDINFDELYKLFSEIKSLIDCRLSVDPALIQNAKDSFILWVNTCQLN